MAHTNQIFCSSIRLHVFRGIVLILPHDHGVAWSNADSFKHKKCNSMCVSVLSSAVLWKIAVANCD